MHKVRDQVRGQSGHHSLVGTPQVRNGDTIGVARFCLTIRGGEEPLSTERTAPPLLAMPILMVTTPCLYSSFDRVFRVGPKIRQHPLASDQKTDSRRSSTNVGRSKFDVGSHDATTDRVVPAPCP